MTIKLNSQQVAEIRALRRAGFTIRSIASAFDVCIRQIDNIVHNRAWAFLTLQHIELPILARDKAIRLRLPAKTRRLTQEQEQIIEQYHKRLEAAIDLIADREAHAISMLGYWRPKPRKHRRETHTRRDQ
jgi:hypothetical protein